VPDLDKNTQQLTPKKEEILSVSGKLFAQNGYAAVSMRQLAGAANITPAALYHHYADKETLYDAVLRHVFTDKASSITDLTKGSGKPEAKLNDLILWLIKLFSSDVVFTKLLHRELLDGDGARIKLLARDVIEPALLQFEKLIQKIAPQKDAKSLAVSTIALISGHFQIRPILQELSGGPNSQNETLKLAEIVKEIVIGSASKAKNYSGAV